MTGKLEKRPEKGQGKGGKKAAKCLKEAIKRQEKRRGKGGEIGEKGGKSQKNV